MGTKLSASTKRFLRGEHTRTVTLSRTEKRKKVKLYEQQRGACAYCSYRFKIDRLTYDHVVRKREGGGNHIGNLVLACPPCNERRELSPDASAKVWARWVVRHRQYVSEYAI